MLQAKQKDVTDAMCSQVINNRIDALDLIRQPLLRALEKVYPVGRRTRLVCLRQRLSGRRAEGAKDLAFGSSTVVDLLFGSLCRTLRLGLPLRANQLLSQITLGSHRPHLIHTDHRTLFR
jgi:hypothetical protein